MADSNPLSSISGALSALSALSPVGALGADSTKPTAAPATNSGPSWLNGKLAQISIILLGLLLIAAGIFSFDKAREVIVTGAKTAAEAAA